MPPRRKTSAEQELEELRAQVVAKNKEIAVKDLQLSRLKTSQKRQALIPKPHGQPSRNGYTTQTAMGLDDDNEHYLRLLQRVYARIFQ
ncbi:hypothetical protein C8R43DRAFT_1117149 [Mycena crocata]|nr:hypothetical protein C8R43DRAFT_1117149 [Mycena crocata]